MIVGIDYSLTSPAICIGDSDNFTSNEIYFLTDRKSHEGKVQNVVGDLHKEHSFPSERYENICDWVLQKIAKYPNSTVLIEDYSFASTGKVFHIAENCGLLKYKLYKAGYKFYTVPPTVVKKYATGKGNADKQSLYNTFTEKTGEYLLPYVSKTGKVGSPASDIVDSFFINQYMRDCLKTGKMEKIYAGN